MKHNSLTSKMNIIILPFFIYDQYNYSYHCTIDPLYSLVALVLSYIGQIQHDMD